MTLRKEIIDALVVGGMPEREASKMVRDLVEQSDRTGWSRGYDEGMDEGRRQAED